MCKNYWVAECPLSFKNLGLAVHLACNHPCSLTSPRKLTKLPPLTDWWWTTKPPRQKAQIAFPPGRGERPLYTEYNTPLTPLTWVTLLCIVLCKSHKHCLIAFQPLLIIGTMFHTSDTSDMPFDLLLILQYFKHFTPLTPLTSKSHSILNVDSNSKYSIRAEFELKPCNSSN